AAVALVGAVAVGGMMMAPQAVAPQAAAQPQGAIDRPGFPGEDFSALAKRLMPSVVNIASRQTVAKGNGLPAFGQNSPLNEFNELLGRGPQGFRRQSSLGSGFIIDPAGYVVTNNHVIEGADEVDVILSDGTVMSAKIVGKDEDVDLALLKVDPKTPLQAVPWANSDEAQVGQWVMAIGNPFGLGGTVTAGIISARNRDISAGSYDDFIQTDAAINKGNSGGPLFNLKGEVVGINTAIISPGDAGGSVGVGFSQPSNFAKVVIAQLRQYGVTKRGTMGLTARSIDQTTAEAYGLKSPQGAIITSVVKGGAAEAAGLRSGDLITALNNQQIKESRDLFRVMGVTQIGSAVSVRYLRNGKPGTASVKLAAGSTEKNEKPTAENQTQALSNILGIKFKAIEDVDRRRHSIPISVRGVVVQAIDTGSDALGKVQIGSVVTEVNFQPVSSPDQALAAADSAKRAGKPVLLQIWDDKETIYVAVRPK
ncbi:MAG TPA: Do family serine endopeptidase, partial [Hyphomonadaceae bacterium]|nr:Do family serine endopeptidase [Hyphomonadaceae bacterium]